VAAFQWYGWRASQAAGLDPAPCHLHTLRHTAASGALQASANVKQVADMLGHKSISTTNGYLQNLDDLGNNAAYMLPY
jgi:site-specific recombinase XerD